MMEGADGTMAKSPEEYWHSFIPVVQDAINKRTQVPSRSGRATYRIWKFDPSAERLFIENENTGRKNSSIGKQEFLISITKLLDAGGVVDCGDMNSVGLHEVVIAVIHPWLETDGEVIREVRHKEKSKNYTIEDNFVKYNKVKIIFDNWIDFGMAMEEGFSYLEVDTPRDNKKYCKFYFYRENGRHIVELDWNEDLFENENVSNGNDDFGYPPHSGLATIPPNNPLPGLGRLRI